MLRYLHVLEGATDTCIEELTRLDNDQDVSDPGMHGSSFRRWIIFETLIIISLISYLSGLYTLA